MNESRAQNVVKALRTRGVDAQVARAGVYQFGVSVALGDGREAIWEAGDRACIEAQVMRDGVLVGFIPLVEGSADFDEATVVEVIAHADYNRPVVMAGSQVLSRSRIASRSPSALARLRRSVLHR